MKEKEERFAGPSGMGDREEPAVFRGAPARGKDVDNCNTSPFSFVESNGATYQIPYIKGKTYEPDFCEEHFHKPQKGSRHKFLYVQQGKKTEKDINLDDTFFNVDPAVPKVYSMLDAHSFLYHNRAFFNPADCNRKTCIGGVRSLRDDQQVDEAHYWVQTMAESFMSAREQYEALEYEEREGRLFEEMVKFRPTRAFPSSRIGEMSNQTRKQLFPLIPRKHAIWDKLRRIRAMDYLWAELPGYMHNPDKHTSSRNGAWIPVSVSNHVKSAKTVGLFDESRQIPFNFGAKAKTTSTRYTRRARTRCTSAQTHRPAFPE